MTVAGTAADVPGTPGGTSVPPAGTGGRPPRPVVGQTERRAEMLAGYGLILVPMILFLVLNIGSVLYEVFVSLWKWNVRSGPVQFRGIANYQAVFADDVFWKAVQNTVYYALIWVPLTMAIGLFLAVIVNQKLRGRDVLPLGLLLPVDRELGRDHDPVDLHHVARGPVQHGPRRRSGSTRCSSSSASGRTRTGSATSAPRSTP